METPGAAEPFERASAAPRGNPVHELRVALTLEDYEQAVAFYRDALGLPVRMSWDEPEGKGTILEAGRATLELLSEDQAELIDRVEVGRRVAGPVRLALEVEDSGRTAEELVSARRRAGGPGDGDAVGRPERARARAGRDAAHAVHPGRGLAAPRGRRRPQGGRYGRCGTGAGTRASFSRRHVRAVMPSSTGTRPPSSRRARHTSPCQRTG